MKRRKNPVALKDLKPGAEFIFHGYDNKDYRATIASRPKRGFIKIRYGVPGFGTTEPPIPIKTLRERLYPLTTESAVVRRTARPNPVNGAHARRLPSSGKTRVYSGKRVTAWGTTRKRGKRQIRLLRGLAHGWKPRPGVPARDVRQAAARLGSETMAYRKGRKWSVIRGSVKAGRFHVIAKGLTDLQLREWYRAHGYKAKAL
jgi:hypothetical protein